MNATPITDRRATVAQLAEELAAPRWGRSEPWAGAYGRMVRLARLAGLVPPAGGPSKAKAAELAAAVRAELGDDDESVPSVPPPTPAAPAPRPPAGPAEPLSATEWAEAHGRLVEARARLLEEVESLRACLATEEQESARLGVALENAELAREEAEQARKAAEEDLEEARRNWHEEQDARDEEAAEKTRTELLADLREVLLTADRRLVEYYGRRLGLELLPMHGRAVA